MLQSKRPESLKRIPVKEELATFSGENQTSAAKIQDTIAINAEKDKVDIKDVFAIAAEYDEDNWRSGKYIEFYYFRPETDDEYNYRIENLEQSDVRAFARVLSEYNAYCLLKEDIKALFQKHFTGGDKQRLSDHQEKLIRQFFNEKSTAELIKEAYDNGRADGEKKYNDLKETMQKSLAHALK